MAELPDLPKELLESIAELLHVPFDYTHFRSVCSLWRHAAPLSPPPFSSRSNIHVIDEMIAGYGSFHLSKRSILQLGIPEPDRRLPSTDWLIKVEKSMPQRMRLFNLLSGSKFDPFPQQIPEILDFTDIRVSEVLEEYVLEYVFDRPSAYRQGDADNLYMEKVAFASSCSGEFVILTVHLSGKLALFKSGDKEWSVIQDLRHPYDDVIFFDGKFYAVDCTGMLVIVHTEPLPSLKSASAPVFGGDKKCLLKCGRDLLLVDVFLSTGMRDDFEIEDYYHNINEDCDGDNESVFLMNERKVRFEVYRLNPLESKWVRLDNLNDWMLFVGNNSTFSVLASDFPGCKGNLIYFTDCCLNQITQDDSFFKGHGVGVYDMDDGSCYNLHNHQGFSQIFWPPPSWLTSTQFKEGLDQLKL